MSARASVPGRRDFISLTVLALLFEAPRHPYEMQRLMHERHKDFAIGKTRSFYDAVARLQRRGLIEPSASFKEGHHPERTVYRLTQSGHDELATWLVDLLTTVSPEYPAFTVALNFLPCFAPPAALQLLRQRASDLEVSIVQVDAGLRALQEQAGLPRLVLLEVEHMRALRSAELEWVRSVVADIAAGRLDWEATGRLGWQELPELDGEQTGPARNCGVSLEDRRQHSLDRQHVGDHEEGEQHVDSTR